MDKRVREALAQAGLAKSRIVLLDALLKLRQACCDPALVKLPGARPATRSAKRDALIELLATLAVEGRKALVFSQFTSMLDLIEVAIDGDPRLATVVRARLDGDTDDRAGAVARFQEGGAQIFLLSLKAGGVGLNLTAADTVIHYDPWWNPAVEHQATDRAHRIGQEKPVFVYKLIASGTVEERILALQARKAELAASVLSGSLTTGSNALSQEDLLALFEPI
jgi:SNF2 family DNA or RNA helicase